MTLTALGMPALRSRTNGIADPRVVPTTGPLVDTFGRVANDLRVSLTDRCNLRCSYCMPERGLRWLPGEQLLRPDELARLIHIAVTRLGVTSVRFTGGEPLLAHHLDEVVAATARLRPRPEISLTTNGVGLARRAGALAEAGLDRVNVSLDSIDRAHFAAITRRDRLAHVLAGLAAAKAAGLTPVKVNAVLDPTTGLGGRRRTEHATRTVRCHRLGVARLLFDVRPHPADRRWPDPQLSVLHRGDRPAPPTARRC